MSLIPDVWVSIDPGDRYVGFATWHGEFCVSAKEVTPQECVELLEMLLGFSQAPKVLDVVVYEKWALYAWNEKSLAGNEFLTSQLIGVIKYLTYRADVEAVGQMASFGKATYRTDWYKALTNKDKRRLPWWGQLKNGDHAKDAWAHGEAFKRGRLNSAKPPPRRGKKVV